MREGDAARRARPREPDDVLRADVGRKDGRADEKPAEVSAREEIVVGGVLVAPGHPPGEAQEETKVQQNDQPIPAAHGCSSVGWGGPRYTSRGPCQGSGARVIRHLTCP